MNSCHKEFGVISTFWYWVCCVFGHDMMNVGSPIFHEDEGLVEQDGDCMRCGMKGTSVLPYESTRTI